MSIHHSIRVIFSHVRVSKHASIRTATNISVFVQQSHAVFDQHLDLTCDARVWWFCLFRNVVATSFYWCMLFCNEIINLCFSERTAYSKRRINKARVRYTVRFVHPAGPGSVILSRGSSFFMRYGVTAQYCTSKKQHMESNLWFQHT